jgi:hypothetical protein
MPKRLEGQKRRGRPPSAKKKARRDDATGALFPFQHGAWNLAKVGDTDQAVARKAIDFLLTMQGLGEHIPEDSNRLFATETLPKFLQSIVDIIAACNDISESQPLSIQREAIEARLMAQILFSSIEKLIEDGNDQEVRRLAAAFTIGQIAAVLPRRSKERDYAIGEKFAKNVQAGAAVRKIKRPAKQKIERALRDEIGKHGKRTLAIENAAALFGVGKNTLRTWIKELSITL